MNNDSERLQYAQWVLERNLAWIAAAEAKTGAIVAIDTAMLGGLAAAYGALAPGSQVAWAHALTYVSGLLLGIAILCAALSLFPKTTGPKTSLLFFGRISENAAEDYGVQFRGATYSDLLNDCLAQIHRNAEITTAKFKWVRASMGWSFVAIIPWVLAIALLTRA